MEFSRLEYWNGDLFPSPGALPHPGIKPSLLHCRWILYQLSYEGSPIDNEEQDSSGAITGIALDTALVPFDY